jgi:crotonobetaine/carnitine-CoA ligase
VARDPDWPEPRGFDDEDLLSLIRRQADKYGDRTFMSFGDGTSMSFAEFRARVAGCRAELKGLGVQSGDRVALMLKNSLFYPVAWLGILTSGAVAVPINSRLRGHDAGYVLGHSESRVVITDDATEPAARDAGGLSGIEHDYFVARAGDPMGELSSPDIGDPPSAHDLANIQYTSGTTGFPKGCMLTQSYWQWMAGVTSRVMGLDEDATFLTSQPHSYIDPQWNVVAALRSAAHLVLLDGFHPSTFMRSVVDFKVTTFYCLGVMPTLLLKQPEQPWEQENSLRSVYCSAIPVRLHEAIEKRWGAPWYEAFGMTESGFNTTTLYEPDHDEIVGTGCIGSPLPHNDVSVLTPEGNLVAPGETGELVLRGNGLMLGYYRNQEATDEFFSGAWGHTGDIAEMDAEGRIYYRGRFKEMIRRAGENISPVEIEATLATHPEVVDCAICPVPDPDVEEEIKAYVVAKPMSTISADDIHSFLADRLAPFKVPRYYEFRDELPHTPSERVAKHLLGDPLNEATVEIARR